MRGNIQLPGEFAVSIPKGSQVSSQDLGYNSESTELQVRLPFIKPRNPPKTTSGEREDIKSRLLGTIIAQEKLSNQPWALDQRWGEGEKRNKVKMNYLSFSLVSTAMGLPSFRFGIRFTLFVLFRGSQANKLTSQPKLERSM